MEHKKFSNISILNEVSADPDLLPKGPVPLWIDVEPEISHKDILKWMKSEVMKEEYSVTVIKNVPIRSTETIAEEATATEEWCLNQGWKRMTDDSMPGTEDQCVILFMRDSEQVKLFPEHFGRARNMLIIVTTLTNNVEQVTSKKPFLITCIK